MKGMTELTQEDSKEEVLDRVEMRAAAYQYEYRGCSQCVLLALQQEFNLPGGSAALKAATFFVAGTARMGNMCGALVGTMLALGLVAGRERIEDPLYGEEIDETSGQPRRVEFARTSFRRFVQEFGSWICRDIQISQLGRSFDLHDPKDHEEFQKAGGEERCSWVVGKAARLAAEIILEMKAEGLVK